MLLPEPSFIHYAEHPHCPNCGRRKLLVRIQPSEVPGRDHHTFECITCRASKTIDVPRSVRHKPTTMSPY